MYDPCETPPEVTATLYCRLLAPAMSAPVTPLVGPGVKVAPLVGVGLPPEVGVGVVELLLLPKPPIAMKAPTTIITINMRARRISSRVLRDFFLAGAGGVEEVALMVFMNSFFMHFPAFR